MISIMTNKQECEEKKDKLVLQCFFKNGLFNKILKFKKKGNFIFITLFSMYNKV